MNKRNLSALIPGVDTQGWMLPEKLGGSVGPASQNPHHIFVFLIILRFSLLPYS